MISPRPQLWLYTQPTDMRKSFNGLIGLVRNKLKREPSNGHGYLFVNRRKTMLKLIYFEMHGYCIWHKRLDLGQFNFSHKDQQVLLNQTDFSALIEGIKIKKVRQFKR